MKKWISVACGLLFLGMISVLPLHAKADVQMPLKQGSLEASYNVKIWQATMKQLKTQPGIKKVIVPKGTYYFNTTLNVPSHIKLSGIHAKESNIVFSKLVTGLKVEENKNAREGIIQAENVTIENLNIRFQSGLKGAAFASLIEVSPKFDEQNYKNYKAFRNITIQNNKLDMKEKGSSIINLGRIEHLIVKNNEVKNSGLQNGISVEFTNDALFKGNIIDKVGRSGIQLYRSNGSPKKTDKIVIEGNTVTNWMQRFGKYNFEKSKANHITPDIMSDAGIDSYGPNNQNVYIQNNTLSAGKINQSLPDNLALLKKYGKKAYPSSRVLLTAIRLSGAKNAVVANNTVRLKGKEIFSFFTSNSRTKAGQTTKPGNILVQNNAFYADGMVAYPIRLFNGQIINKRGFELTKNRFSFSKNSQITNYYRALVEVRLASQKLNLRENRIEDRGQKLGYLISAPAPLKELWLTKNTRNGKNWRNVRGEFLMKRVQ